MRVTEAGPGRDISDGKPSDGKPSDAKHRVLEMAERLFMDKGYAAITLRDIAEAFRFVRPDKGEESVGGMKTKLEAVRKVLSAEISAHILDGRKPGQLHAALQGGDVGTAFAVRHHPLKP
jgi:hypothetical protein